MYFALDEQYLYRDEAMAAGAAWLLERLNREPTDNEIAHRRRGKAREGFHNFTHKRRQPAAAYGSADCAVTRQAVRSTS